MVSRFPDSPDSPRKPPLLIHCGRGFARIAFHSKHLEHLECGYQPHAQDRGAEKRLQLAGRSGSGYGLESPSPGGARSQGHNTGLRGLVCALGFP